MMEGFFFFVWGLFFVGVVFGFFFFFVVFVVVVFFFCGCGSFLLFVFVLF